MGMVGTFCATKAATGYFCYYNKQGENDSVSGFNNGVMVDSATYRKLIFFVSIFFNLFFFGFGGFIFGFGGVQGKRIEKKMVFRVNGEWLSELDFLPLFHLGASLICHDSQPQFS